LFGILAAENPINPQIIRSLSGILFRHTPPGGGLIRAVVPVTAPLANKFNHRHNITPPLSSAYMTQITPIHYFTAARAGDLMNILLSA